MAGSRLLTSRANSAIKTLRGLADDPRRSGRALLDGIHLVGEALRQGVPLRQVLVSANGLSNPQIRALLGQVAAVERLELGDGLFRDLVGVVKPTGIAAVVDIPAQAPADPAGEAVLLDAVQDAGNVGAILRTAAAAGVRQVLLGPGCAGAWTPRVLRAGQGAHFRLEIHERIDLSPFIAESRLPSVATVATGGRSLYELDLVPPALWLVGNEGAGLSPNLLAAASIRATIPMSAGSESLNVAAALAVCLFEARRQRLK